jgi:hypothetical protein
MGFNSGFKGLRLYPVHQTQFAYQPGISTETALHSGVTHMQDALEQRKVAHGALIDVEGDFDRTSFEGCCIAWG